MFKGASLEFRVSHLGIHMKTDVFLYENTWHIISEEENVVV